MKQVQSTVAALTKATESGKSVVMQLPAVEIDGHTYPVEHVAIIGAKLHREQTTKGAGAATRTAFKDVALFVLIPARKAGGNNRWERVAEGIEFFTIEPATLEDAAKMATADGIDISQPQASLTSRQEVVIKSLRKSLRFTAKSTSGRSAWYSFRLALSRYAVAPKMSLTQYILAAPVSHLPASAHIC
jgi:hypothetical protein